MPLGGFAIGAAEALLLVAARIYLQTSTSSTEEIWCAAAVDPKGEKREQIRASWVTQGDPNIAREQRTIKQIIFPDGTIKQATMRKSKHFFRLLSAIQRVISKPWLTKRLSPRRDRVKTWDDPDGISQQRFEFESRPEERFGFARV